MPQNGDMPGGEPGGQQGQTADSGSSGLPGESGVPGSQNPGGQPGDSGMPGSQNPGSQSGGDSGAQAGNDLPSYGEAGTGSGDLVYGSEDDPFGTIGSNTSGNGDGEGDTAGNDSGGAGGDSGSGDSGPGGSGAAGSTQARVGELDARLEEGYGEFDGMILGERERAQGMGDGEDRNAQTRGAYGGGMPGEEGQGDGDEQGGAVIARNTSSNAGGGYMPDSGNREGDFDNSSQGEQFPVPEDIPSGNDDDVVARQLREAAQSEPDPEVRERLWDEYRRYTGLPVDDGEE